MNAAPATVHLPPSNPPWAAAVATLALFLASIVGCASLPAGSPPTPSYAMADTGETRWGQLAAALQARHGTASSVHLLGRGLEAFAARLALVTQAQRSLDIQTYIWRSDQSGRLLAHALLQAADRGVRVRLLVDDLGAAPYDGLLRLLDAHPAIEVRLFNPVPLRSARLLGALLTLERSHRRMHNKSFIADNRAAIVGGRNVGDPYFETGRDLDFDDLDVLALGDAAPAVSDSFDAYWNDPAAHPLATLVAPPLAPEDVLQGRTALADFAAAPERSPLLEALRESVIAQELAAGAWGFSPAKVTVVADDPSKLAQRRPDPASSLFTRVQPAFSALQHQVAFISPYFVPGAGGLANLQRLRARGVSVRVITNSLLSTDVAAVHVGYAAYRPALLEAGIELFEVKPEPRRSPRRAAGERAPRPPAAVLRSSSRASLHAKVVVFDCRSLFVGSMNVDPRSIFINTEVGMLVESPELAARVCAAIDEFLPDEAWRVESDPSAPAGMRWSGTENGELFVLSQEPGLDAWRRLQLWLLSIVPPDWL